MAPRPPPAAKRFTFRSAIRTPEQNPYFAARFTFMTQRVTRSILSKIRAPMPAPERLITPRFASLWLYSFVTFFSAFQLLPAIPFRIIDLGGSTAAAGWFLSVYTLASAFSAPLMGTIADRVGRRRL